MLSQVATRLRSWLGSNSADKSTSAGRAQDRHRRISLAAATYGLAKAVGMATPLITTPLTLHYLGDERYGLWMTIVGVIAMLIFADFGMGNGLLTSLSHAHGKEDAAAAQRYISSTFFMLVGISLALLTMFFCVSPLIPWGKALNLTAVDPREAAATMAAAFAAFAIGIPATVVQRTQLAYQEGFQSNLWQCVASVATLVVVVVAVWLQAPLPVLVFCYSLVPALVGYANGWYFFHVQRPGLWPRWRHFEARTAFALIKTGMAFLGVSALMAVSISSDNIIVAQVVNMESVKQLAIPTRLAAYLSLVPTMLSMPVWAANGEALARGDYAWVRRITRKVLWINLAATSLGVIFFVALGPLIFKYWLGAKHVFPVGVLAGVGFFAVAMAVASPFFMVLNAMNQVWVQVKWYAWFAPVALGGKILLGHWFGVAGIAWGTGLAYVPLILLPAALGARRVLGRAHSPLEPVHS